MKKSIVLLLSLSILVGCSNSKSLETPQFQKDLLLEKQRAENMQSFNPSHHPKINPPLELPLKCGEPFPVKDENTKITSIICVNQVGIKYLYSTYNGNLSVIRYNE